MDTGKKIWRLTVRSEFSAGHALRCYEGKCERMHGHNFAVELTVEGDTLTPDTELLVDFKLLKNLLKETLRSLDHQLLNEVPPFDVRNPSSENLARHIWRQVDAPLQRFGVRPHSVTVSEKAAQSATYMEL